MLRSGYDGLVNDLRGLRVFKACSRQLMLMLAYIEVVTLIIDSSKVVVQTVLTLVHWDVSVPVRHLMIVPAASGRIATVTCCNYCFNTQTQL